MTTQAADIDPVASNADYPEDIYRSHSVPCSDEEIENVGSDK